MCWWSEGLLFQLVVATIGSITTINVSEIGTFRVFYWERYTSFLSNMCQPLGNLIQTLFICRGKTSCELKSVDQSRALLYIDVDKWGSRFGVNSINPDDPISNLIIKSLSHLFKSALINVSTLTVGQMTYIQGVVHSVNSFWVLLQHRRVSSGKPPVYSLCSRRVGRDHKRSKESKHRANVHQTRLQRIFFYQKECLESLEVQTTCGDGALW